MRQMRNACHKNAPVATENQLPLDYLVAMTVVGTMVNKGLQVPNWILGNSEDANK